MKTIKTPITNPELCQIGQKVQVLMNARWIGADTDLPNVWLNGKIIEVLWGKNDTFKDKYNVPCICVKLRASHKYKTPSMENLMILPPNIIEDNCIKFI